MCWKLFFIFTNLIQIEEKTHVQVTVRFPNFAFNENIHIYCFHEWDIFLIHLFNNRRKNKRTLLLWVLRKKKKLLLKPFSVKFVMLPARSIALANWFACVLACMPIALFSLTSLHLKVKFNKTIIVLIMGAIVC